MIKKNVKIGELKGITHIFFGKGDVSIMIGKTPELNKCVGFYNSTQKRKVGEIFPEGSENIDSVPVQVLFTFEKPESITALMMCLLKLQGQMMFDK